MPNALPGAVRQRANGKWQVVITLPMDADGRYPQVSRTFDTRREAEQWRLDQTDSRRRPVVERGMTVAGLLDKWLAHQDGRIAATTHKTYSGYVAGRIVPNLGHIPLDRLSVDDVDNLYNRLSKQGLSPATVRQVHAILRGALSWGRKRRYVDMNVAVDADPPSVTQKRITPPTPLEVAKLLIVADELDDEFGVLVRLAAATGARRGTIACFRQTDFSFIDNTVLIDRSVAVVDGVRHVKGLKAGRGGVIPVDERTMAEVHNHLTWLHERARACEVTLDGDFYLFAEDVACTRPINPDSITARWETVRRRAGLPKVRFHDLRHFVSTELIAAGFDPVTVADRAKHSSPKMTLDVYGHAKTERSVQAGDHIGRLLG